MRSVGLHSMSGREKEGNKERTWWAYLNCIGQWLFDYSRVIKNIDLASKMIKHWQELEFVFEYIRMNSSSSSSYFSFISHL